jgi:hypothetical protein
MPPLIVCAESRLAVTPVGAVTRRERDLAGDLGTKRWCS